MTNNILNRKRLRGGTALQALALLGAGAILTVASPAFAQTTQSSQSDDDAATAGPAGTNTGQTAQDASAVPQSDAGAAPESEDLVVTGTLFRNPSAATASPVTTLTAEDLDNRGITTVADAVQTLSANNAGTAPPSWSAFGFATGASAPSLRGLNDAYTLTVFDGLRSAPYPLADDGSRNFVDINTIPDSIVDRVQVLQDGASSTYGADAIAGVINVIIKKEIVGLHANASAGISESGDAGEQRLDATYGVGDLDKDGWNFWINGEYQHNDKVMMRDRGYPYNTADLSKICGSSLGGNGYQPGQTTCMYNGIANGIQADGSYGGVVSTAVPFVQAYDPETGKVVGAGAYEMLNPAAGCGALTAINLTAAQRQNADGNTVYPATVCQQDFLHDYQTYSPDIQRIGGNARFTANVGSQAQAYVMFNFYQVKTDQSSTPLSFEGQTAAGGTRAVLSPLLLPVYVCSSGVDCDTAADRQLNPNNPYAADGNEARIIARFPENRRTETTANTYRVSTGIDGSFGDTWGYSLAYTASRVELDVDQYGFINAGNLLDVINDGSFNFVDLSANSQQMLDYVAPPSHNSSYSVLQEVHGVLSKELFTLPGGPLQIAIGGAYRYEAIHNPSANPANEEDPYDRYYSINAVGVEGSRNVKSAFFEVNAPVLDSLNLKASGRYDKYSSGQSNFSPKFEAQFQPIPEVKIRGTYSRGFRVPSFNEAYGLPTTGYINTAINTDTDYGKAFVAAHGGNSYATGSYSYGLTSTGNPGLDPEKSRSFTAGVVLTPTPRVTFTADYWNIKIKNQISGANYTDVLEQYYSNNGVVNIPGITVTQGIADPEHPDALPLIGEIQYSYQNADSSKASGIDFTGTTHFNIGNVRWTSSVNASYLIHLGKTLEGTAYEYAGTLSPCDVTSCSGAPEWRGNWVNTFAFDGGTSFTITGNYSGGYDLASIDYGGVKGDCLDSLTVSVVTYEDGVTPVKCRVGSFISIDLHVSQEINDSFTIYADMKNALNADAPFDPSAGYSLYQFNPAWASSGFIGRYFRVGAKVDF
ncbi:TonB-dependent receptor [Stakelama sp. CBK3Z-3]|uniref:TonB-dependent receptor n=1 Tax=Stakelama flava TaxID=2860338 RepID=A0ABS6XL68_9SPHN|nr:TonB-dependent receptor [Stakelama flava]MBW4330959.1 TonB-dependent receptor [Stakelama flava]